VAVVVADAADCADGVFEKALTGKRGAMILTSNCGFAEWGEVFGDPVVATALLDRLLHHAIVIQIEGSSYRLRQHADLVPEHVRSKVLIQPAALAPQPKRRGRPPKNGAIVARNYLASICLAAALVWWI
jgi:hypothetical protein